MRDGQQVTLRGAEAIAALRVEMGGAQGTAARFREQLLDTFEGQKTLLQGTLQTFAVVLGEPFAAVFKPIVRTLVDVLNLILRAFQAIPAPIKRIFAGIVLAAGSFLMLVGGVIAAKAAIALLVIAFKALGITVGGILATLLPAILIVAVLGAVVAGFVVAFQRNVGGIADFVRRIGERVSLFFNGLKQLFQQGGVLGCRSRGTEPRREPRAQALSDLALPDRFPASSRCGRASRKASRARSKRRARCSTI